MMPLHHLQRAALILWLAAWMGCEATPGLASDLDLAPHFLISSCGTCMKDACASEIARCQEDPGSAGYLRCLGACPVSGGADGMSGDADPACEMKCALPQSTVGRRAVQDLYICRSRGAGASCPTCLKAGPSPGAKDPLLAQQCMMQALDPNDLCDTCEKARCCQTKAACGDDCKKLLICLQMAKNASESFTCWKSNQAGIAAWARRFACNNVRCHRECGATPAPCVDCSLARCGDAHFACDSNPDCALLNACQSDCAFRLSGDPRAACYGDCLRTYSKGARLQLDSQLCSLQLCQPECGDPDGNL